MPAAIAIPAIMGAVGIGGSLASGIMGSNAASDAASAQAQASKYAADLQKESADNSLAFQKQVYGDQQTNLAPYMAEGKAALGQLTDGTAPGGQFTQTINADNFKTLDPGYDFRMAEGEKAMQRAEAAGGSIGSGGALKAATQYGQNYASGEFDNAFNRFTTTQNNQFNHLASLAGVGQAATNSANTAGTSAANNVTNINTTTGEMLGNDAIAAGNATASGYVGSANAWASADSGLTKSTQGALSLYALMNRN